MKNFIDKVLEFFKELINSNMALASFLITLALTIVLCPEFVLGYIIGTSTSNPYDQNRNYQPNPYYVVSSLLGLILGLFIKRLF